MSASILTPLPASQRAADVSPGGVGHGCVAQHGSVEVHDATPTDIQSAQNPAHTNPLGGIEKCYRDNIIGGPGPFVMVARDYNSFGRAMVKKLIAEISTAPAELRSASAGPQGRRP